MAKTRKKMNRESAAEQSTAPQSVGDTRAANDDRDRIAARAYELYLERGGVGGDAMEDWLAAEREFSKDRDDQNENDRNPNNRNRNARDRNAQNRNDQ